MTRKIPVWVAASYFLLSMAAVAAAADMPGGEMGELEVVTATVDKVDLSTREVTLKGVDGRLETVRVGPEARNLGQVKAGDVVTMKYYRAVAIFVAPPGARPPVTEATDVQRAPLGAKPGGQVTNVVEAAATVEAMDPARRMVTIRGPRGNVTTLKVGDQVNLGQVKVGDQVIARYTEAVAISVEKP